MYKILLATDGSTHATKAAQYVKELCEKIPDANVTVVHVVDTGEFGSRLGPVPGRQEAVRQLLEQGQQIVDEAKRIIVAASKPVDTVVEIGKPAHVLCDIVGKGAYDLIVVGSRGRGSVGALFLGSVSNTVVGAACAPVLVVR